jgi:hypothetical protein
MTDTTAGPARKPDGTGRIHLRLDPIHPVLACGTWGARWLVPVPTGDVVEALRCKKCWPPKEGK